MPAKWIEAKLYWGSELLEITYTAARGDLRLEDVRIEDLGLPALPEDGDLSVELAIVPRVEKPIPRSSGDGRVASGLIIAASLHLVLGALAFHGRASSDEEEESARTAMKAYVAAIDARATVKDDLPLAPIAEKDVAAHDEKSGAAGNPARTNDVGRMKATRGDERHAANPKASGNEVSTFGMLALVAADHPGENAGSSPWAKDLGPSAMGNMFGATIDDAFGSGGLGLTGNGEGGGGKGKGVGIDGVLGSGFGTCGGCRGTFRGEHRTRSPSVRCAPPEQGGCTTVVNGRLPPEAIQRVVRASFGRFRACYEQGLQRDPGLEGRIAAKFVIARDGSVSMASVGESSISDANVTKCVERAFYNLTFPEPEGGIVTVVYPIYFSTSL